jgi:DNA-binding NarL/FixJ family response regulator
MPDLRVEQFGPGPVRIYAADPRAQLIDRLAVLAETNEDLRLVGAQTSGSAAVSSVTLAKPNVVLVGDHFPDADGLDVCDHISRALPAAAVIVVTDKRTDSAMLRALEAGACGLVAPVAPDEELVAAILRAADGELLMTRATILRLFRLSREQR